MKYLLILLFLFSTYSFSGVVDGKGISCVCKESDFTSCYINNFTQINRQILFQNDSAYLYSMEEENDSIKVTYQKLSNYTTTSEFIKWKQSYVSSGIRIEEYSQLNRKSLIYKTYNSLRNNMETVMTFSCNVLNKEEFLQNILSLKKAKEKRLEKRLKGNKL